MCDWNIFSICPQFPDLFSAKVAGSSYFYSDLWPLLIISFISIFFLFSYNMERNHKQKTNTNKPVIALTSVLYHRTFISLGFLSFLLLYVILLKLTQSAVTLKFGFVSTVYACGRGKKEIWMLQLNTVDKIFYFHDYFSADFSFLPAGKGWHTCQENVLQLRPAV